MTLPFAGPRGLTQATADGLDGAAEIRSGLIVAVTSRGVDVQVAEGLIENASHLDSYNPAIGDPVVCSVYRDSWTVLGRPVGPGTATDYATPGTGVGSTILAGCVLTGTGSTLASSTGSAVVVPRYRCTFYHPPGHQVLVLCGVSWYSSVLNDTLWITLWNAVTGGQVNIVDLTQAGTIGFGHFETFGAILAPPTGGGKVDIYMQVQRAAGTGASRVDDASGRRGWMVALDLGDSSVMKTV